MKLLISAHKKRKRTDKEKKKAGGYLIGFMDLSAASSLHQLNTQKIRFMNISPATIPDSNII